MTPSQKVHLNSIYGARITSTQGEEERQQISDEGEAKFLFGGIKRSVYVKSDRELKYLSQYLGMDLKKHFMGYFGANTTVTPIILNCTNYRSISGDIPSTIFNGLSAYMTGETFEDKKRKALSFQAFITPESHLEEFV